MDEPPLANLTTLMHRLQSRIGETASRLVVAWLIIGAAVGGANSLGWLEKFELLFYDTAIALSGEAVADSPVVLVGATDADLQKYGWPLPDERLAVAVEQIATAGALAVAVQ